MHDVFCNRTQENACVLMAKGPFRILLHQSEPIVENPRSISCHCHTGFGCITSSTLVEYRSIRSVSRRWSVNHVPLPQSATSAEYRFGARGSLLPSCRRYVRASHSRNPFALTSFYRLVSVQPSKFFATLPPLPYVTQIRVLRFLH
jgi:hypothetical protein